MNKRKLALFALAVLTTLSLPMHAEESDTATTASPKGAEPSAPATAAGTSDEAYAAMQERWRERDARYEDLKRRAKEAGVMLPDDPPWKTARQEMMPGMTERLQRHREAMSRARDEHLSRYGEFRNESRPVSPQGGVDSQYMPPMAGGQVAGDEEWARYQAVIDGMSDEERAACHAMHRRHMGGMMYNMPERPMMRGPAVGPGMMGPGSPEPGWAPGAMGPGYGYGPNPYGPRNFWDPNQ